MFLQACKNLQLLVLKPFSMYNCILSGFRKGYSNLSNFYIVIQIAYGIILDVKN
jgi:hypothetical protein